MPSSFSSRNFDIVIIMDAVLITLACVLIMLAYREINGAPVRHSFEIAETVLAVTDDLSSEDELSSLRLDGDGVASLRRRLLVAERQVTNAIPDSVFGIFSVHPMFAELSTGKDAFREQALAAIASGQPSFAARFNDEGITYFRVAGPLRATIDCRSCVSLGLPAYAKGDVIGIREVVVPVSDSHVQTVNKLLYACGMLAASLMVFLGMIIPMIKRSRDEKAQMRQMADSLELQASTDPLTGLHNRRHFEQSLETLFNRFNTMGAPLGLLVFDLDHFKRVNDTHGHDAGDLVLREVALRLKAITREGDIVARVGGEEFAVLAPHATMEQLLLVAERYREMIGALKIDIGKVVLRPTISIGVATNEGDFRHSSDLFKAADRKLYQAKREGRNRVAA